MLSKLLKKKITDEQVATLFSHSILNLIDQGYPLVLEMVNECSDFTSSPNLKEDNIKHFSNIVLGANILYISDYFDSYQDVKIVDQIYKKLGECLGMYTTDIKKEICDMQSFMEFVNKPSKNIRYAMSKAFFHKYGLSPYQKDFFKNTNNPDPNFLRKLDELFVNFLFDWECIRDKYRIA